MGDCWGNNPPPFCQLLGTPFGYFWWNCVQVGVKNGYHIGTPNESIVRQSTTFGTSPRATLGGPRGEMPVRSVHPIPGGGATVAPGKRPRGARKGPLRKEGTLVEDGLLTHMGAVQPLGSMWVESGAWRRRRVRHGLKVDLLAAAGFDMG